MKQLGGWLGLLLAAVLALGGCGGTAAEPGQGPSSGPTASASAGAEAADLTVVVGDGTRTVSTWHLTCAPDGGDHPDPQAACRALNAHGAQALPPVRGDVACTQIYGGASTAVVTGLWKGEAVNSKFSLVDGCQVARWEALLPLLPRVKGAQ